MKDNKIKSNINPKHTVTRQHKTGKVMSTQMNSTIVVAVDSFITHPLYDKKMRRTRRFLVHDPESTAKLGDIVTIEESRPISKLKRWILISVDKPVDVMPSIDSVEQDNEVVKQS
ncbi:30S ribosomal protein S17 [Patescibacteria group bacterium]|nr:30S ribosomal protein S17 [Patescibacteria group bacterium]